MQRYQQPWFHSISMEICFAIIEFLPFRSEVFMQAMAVKPLSKSRRNLVFYGDHFIRICMRAKHEANYDGEILSSMDSFNPFH